MQNTNSDKNTRHNICVIGLFIICNRTSLDCALSLYIFGPYPSLENGRQWTEALTWAYGGEPRVGQMTLLAANSVCIAILCDKMGILEVYRLCGFVKFIGNFYKLPAAVRRTHAPGRSYTVCKNAGILICLFMRTRWCKDGSVCYSQ